MSDEPVEGDAPTPEPVSEEQAPVQESPVVVEVASAMGWVPQDQYRGDPKKWRDATTFLKNTPDVIDKLNKRVETISRTTDRVIEQNARRLEAQIRAELAQATEAGDTEGALHAADRLAEARRSNPMDPASVQRAFRERNPWFGENDDATAIAEAAAGRVAAKGIADVAQQTAAAERAVRKAMPELFDDEPEDRPSRSTPTRGAPAVTGGQRAAQGVQREPGWAELPARVRNDMTDDRLKRWGFTADKAGREEYAKLYNSQKRA